tara:strand:- start:42 stop:221 length:180 start_codon:yes stop_codon:yes gene_type:complete
MVLDKYIKDMDEYILQNIITDLQSGNLLEAEHEVQEMIVTAIYEKSASFEDRGLIVGRG